MDAYDLHEGRFIQWVTIDSAANAHSVATTAVPEGKIQTILAAGYSPSDTETENCQFQIYRPGRLVPISEPVSFAFTAGSGLYLSALNEGMELKLYPGESLMVARQDHAAGTTMSLRVRFIESDLPLYDYVEPQEKLRMEKFRRSIVPGAVSPIGGGRASALGGVGMGGGRGGVPRPK